MSDFNLNFPAFTASVREEVGKNWKSADKIYDKMIKVDTLVQEGEKKVGLAKFGLFKQQADTQPIPLDTIKQGYSASFESDPYQLGWTTTETELRQAKNKGSVALDNLAKKASENIVDSTIRTLDTLVTDFFSSNLDATWVGGVGVDGVYYYNTNAHKAGPDATITNQSNKITTAFSQTAFLDLWIKIKNVKGLRDEPMSGFGLAQNLRLIAHPSNMEAIEKCINRDNSTAENGTPNMMKFMADKVFYNPYLKTTTEYHLIDIAMMEAYLLFGAMVEGIGDGKPRIDEMRPMGGNLPFQYIMPAKMSLVIGSAHWAGAAASTGTV